MLLHDFSNCAPILEVVTPAATYVHRYWNLVYCSNPNPEDQSSSYYMFWLTMVIKIIFPYFVKMTDILYHTNVLRILDSQGCSEFVLTK
jgi:hypothetical protein